MNQPASFSSLSPAGTGIAQALLTPAMVVAMVVSSGLAFAAVDSLPWELVVFVVCGAVVACIQVARERRRTRRHMATLFAEAESLGSQRPDLAVTIPPVADSDAVVGILNRLIVAARGLVNE